MHIPFDGGGIHTGLAVSQDKEKLENTTIFDTPQSFEEGIKRICQQIHIISKGEKTKTIAGGVACRFETPVYFENDAALGDISGLYGALSMV